MHTAHIVDLRFPMLQYGRTQTPWDLSPFLYRGGASIRVDRAEGVIRRGELGGYLKERVPLVLKIHALLSNDLVEGRSRSSAHSKISALRRFFTWCDERDIPLSLEDVASSYLRWSDYLLQSYRAGGFSNGKSIYYLARIIATLLDRALEREISLSKSTRIRKPKHDNGNLGSISEKQNLQDSFLFGRLLSDICNGLSWEACVGTLPVSVTLRTGQVLEQWCGLPHPERRKIRRGEARKPWEEKACRLTLARREADKTLLTRYMVVNLRIECELLIFIAQTGMNFTQAYTLRLDQFHYVSHLDGYQVRAFKNRRQGEVLFEIFKAYREWFERYLEFRNRWFPNESEDLLFPFVRNGGRLAETAPQFTRLRVICSTLKMRLIRPRKLRGVRINWLLRESHSVDEVASLAQHSVETLRYVYAKPHPQIAKIEISRFHQRTDPSFSSPAPGLCVSVQPTPIEEAPLAAPLPDCINASGCLFCSQHRDIESEDHVWSLSSLRHLKIVELTRYHLGDRSAIPHPTISVIERLTAKLVFFEESSPVRKLWVEEAEARVREGNFHPAWDIFIQLAEVGRKSAW